MRNPLRLHGLEGSKFVFLLACNSVLHERRMQPTVYLVAVKSVFSADLQTILRCIARNAGGAIAGLCAVRAPFWSPKRGDIKGFM